jgi:hypothetical protein
MNCRGCGGAVREIEEGRCAFCRMRDRGDNRLIAHNAANPGCACGCRDAPARLAELGRCAGCGAEAAGKVAGHPACRRCSPRFERALLQARPLPLRWAA